MFEKILSDLSTAVARARRSVDPVAEAEIWLGIELADSLAEVLGEARGYALADFARAGLSEDEALERLAEGPLRHAADAEQELRRALEGLRVLLEELHQRAAPADDTDRK